MRLWRVRQSRRPVHSVVIEYKITPPVPCMLVCVLLSLVIHLFLWVGVSSPSPLLSSPLSDSTPSCPKSLASFFFSPSGNTYILLHLIIAFFIASILTGKQQQCIIDQNRKVHVKSCLGEELKMMMNGNHTSQGRFSV